MYIVVNTQEQEKFFHDYTVFSVDDFGDYWEIGNASYSDDGEISAYFDTIENLTFKTPEDFADYIAGKKHDDCSVMDLNDFHKFIDMLEQ